MSVKTAHMMKEQLKRAVFAAQRRGNAAPTKTGRLLPGEFRSSSPERLFLFVPVECGSPSKKSNLHVKS